MVKNLTPSVIKIFSLYKDLPITHVLLLLLCFTLTWASLDILNSIDAVKNHESKTKEISINLNSGNKSLQPELVWISQKINNGDNLSAVFERVNLNALDLIRLINATKIANLNNVFPGEKLLFGLTSANSLQEFHYIKSKTESYIFKRVIDQYQVEHRIAKPDKIVNYRHVVIQDSLYLAGKKAQLSDQIIMEIVNIFGWDIDFVFDIRPGDTFTVLFEENFVNGEKLPDEKVIAASFNLKSNEIIALRYQNNSGLVGYFTPQGINMKKAFLRAPLDIFKISSGFNLRRKHPIHKKIKAHRGVDYAAPVGTSVYASGDGKVVDAGFNRFNGNYVFIEHGSIYQTKYLHLDKLFVKRGDKVRQRQTIGTVGSTGYSTGPHLHYEFLVNGVHRNPRTVSLPKAEPLSGQTRSSFQESTKDLIEKLRKNKQSRFEN